MRTSSTARSSTLGRLSFVGPSVLLALSGMIGCASHSISQDVVSVRELSNVGQMLRDVSEESVLTAVADDETVAGLLREPLDANAVVRIALISNRELRAQLRELGVPRGRLIQASTLPNPTIEVELLPERDTHIELTAEYDITAALLTPARAKAARPMVDAARASVASEVLTTGYRARVAYYSLVAATAQLGVAQRMFDAQVASRDTAQALYDAGNLLEIDLARQEMALSRSRVQTALRELAVAEQREALVQMLGLHGPQAALTVQGELPPLPKASAPEGNVERQAIDSNLELKAMQWRLLALSRSSGYLNLSGWLPDVALDVHALAGEPDAERARALRWGAGLQASLPLFDRNQGELRVAEAEFDALLERFYGKATAVRSAARTLRNRVVSAGRRAETYGNRIVPAQRRITELALLRYNGMQMGVFELITAHQEQYEAEVAAVDTALEYWIARAAFDALLAGAQIEVSNGSEVAAPDQSAAAASTGGH